MAEKKKTEETVVTPQQNLEDAEAKFKEARENLEAAKKKVIPPELNIQGVKIEDLPDEGDLEPGSLMPSKQRPNPDWLETGPTYST